MSPTAIILQFVFTFGVWILSDETGLSAVLTMVSHAATLKRMGLRRTPARLRVPTNAVWSSAVFALNIFAFVFIGLQLRPIIEASTEDELVRYLMVAGAVIPTVIAVRCGWVMSFNGLIRWKQERYGFHPPRPMLRPSIGGGLVVSWSGMRGIVTLAAAMALPKDFPHRDMIVLVAFGVTLGTLVIQGLTLKPLLRVLHLRDDDPVGRETDAGREHAFRAGIAAIDESQSPMAAVVRARFLTLLASLDGPDTAHGAAAAVQGTIYRQALDAARQALLAMRKADEIGDDAYQRVEQELDSMEIALSKIDRSR
jgi:NhaP-type Na+/H+ or K+/H+ antiporter